MHTHILSQRVSVCVFLCVLCAKCCIFRKGPVRDRDITHTYTRTHTHIPKLVFRFFPPRAGFLRDNSVHLWRPASLSATWDNSVHFFLFARCILTAFLRACVKYYLSAPPCNIYLYTTQLLQYFCPCPILCFQSLSLTHTHAEPIAASELSTAASELRFFEDRYFSVEGVSS